MRSKSFMLLGMLAAMSVAPAAIAADHADGPAASADKSADITDLFTWVSPDAKTTYLVMDIGKDAKATDKFSNVVKYVFHTQSMPAYGAAAALVKSTDIICTFDVAQKISCWVGTKDFLTGDASPATGLASASGKVKVFAGLRDDPFFFNITGFTAVASSVKAAAHTPGVLTFNADGCPVNLGQTAVDLATQLAHGTSGAAPTDGFGAFDVLSLVLAVDTTLLNTGGPVVSVWASTNK